MEFLKDVSIPSLYNYATFIEGWFENGVKGYFHTLENAFVSKLFSVFPLNIVGELINFLFTFGSGK